MQGECVKIGMAAKGNVALVFVGCGGRFMGTTYRNPRGLLALLRIRRTKGTPYIRYRQLLRENS